MLLTVVGTSTNSVARAPHGAPYNRPDIVSHDRSGPDTDPARPESNPERMQRGRHCLNKPQR